MDQEEFDKLTLEVKTIINVIDSLLEPLASAMMDVARGIIEINQLLTEELDQSEDEEYDV